MVLLSGKGTQHAPRLVEDQELYNTTSQKVTLFSPGEDLHLQAAVEELPADQDIRLQPLSGNSGFLEDLEKGQDSVETDAMAETSVTESILARHDFTGALDDLSAMVSDMRDQRVLPASARLRDLARAALTALSQREIEDVSDWATRLVEDIRNAND